MAVGVKKLAIGRFLRMYTGINFVRTTLFVDGYNSAFLSYQLVHRIYILRYLRDPQFERNVHRSQNHIESYHQLRSAILSRLLKKFDSATILLLANKY
ncbi:Tn3 family transposase [Photorhabdus temperata]|uniref:Tn3 transposase DDE n=2 Tax=Photorhabdus temperata TaxID=574560 RepID=A0A081RXX8_PHOTE|nr:hypothetical protein O185_19805 [Photorhabdus temperata J3]KER03531.1 Tn3 transposase DDE [Photorhabdus temperata subsp. temperata Meg1]